MSDEILLRNGKVVTPFDVVEADIKLGHGKIQGIGRKLKGANAIDCKDKFIIPGLIDIHIHGCGGFSAMDGKIYEMSLFLADHGITSFVPTTVTAPKDRLKTVAGKVFQAMRDNNYVSQVLGLNLEGPWISRKKPGAQSKQHIRKSSMEEFDEINESNVVKIITLAPEENMDIIKQISKRTIVSIGHSNADYDTAKRAVAMGAKLFTHTFNAMSGFHHREPGVAGAALESDETYCEIIPDLIHVHSAAIKILIKAKGVDKVILVTDAIEAAGLGDGEYELNLGRASVRNGACRLPNGNLAGSTLTLDRGVRNIVNMGINLKDAIKMATVNPAVLLGIEDKKAVLQ
jgi:N-acetylglucosamine-6-phosphate deacetylase